MVFAQGYMGVIVIGVLGQWVDCFSFCKPLFLNVGTLTVIGCWNRCFNFVRKWNREGRGREKHEKNDMALVRD